MLAGYSDLLAELHALKDECNALYELGEKHRAEMVHTLAVFENTLESLKIDLNLACSLIESQQMIMQQQGKALASMAQYLWGDDGPPQWVKQPTEVEQ